MPRVGRQKGFSLLEILIVAAMLAVLGLVVWGGNGRVTSNLAFRTEADNVITQLRSAQAKAQAGELSSRWGVHFVNGERDYYELFSTASEYLSSSTIVHETVYLHGATLFIDPTEGASSTLVFEPISSKTSGGSITLGFWGETRIITATTLGRIY